MKKIDLHTHSSASDGQLTPRELVTLAGSCGVGLLSLTDHDTTAGLAEAEEEAGKLGIQFVPGIEVSTLWHHCSIHIVGLGIEYRDGKLDEVFKSVGEKRLARGEEIGRKLDGLGFPNATAGALRFATRREALSRMHFARWMEFMHYVPNTQTAFDLYLGDGKPAFVETVWPTIEEGIEIIRSAGGIPILAHPGRYRLPDGITMTELILEAVSKGARGIEVCSGSQRPEVESMLADMAREHNYVVSQGSDFHSLDGNRPRPGGTHRVREDLDAVWNYLPVTLPV